MPPASVSARRIPTQVSQRPPMDLTQSKSNPNETAPQPDAAIAQVSTLVESAVIETRVMGTRADGTSSTSESGSAHTLKVVRFESLARCGDEIWIEHEGQLYRLRKTRQGKLILTK